MTPTPAGQTLPVLYCQVTGLMVQSAACWHCGEAFAPNYSMLGHTDRYCQDCQRSHHYTRPHSECRACKEAGA